MYSLKNNSIKNNMVFLQHFILKAFYDDFIFLSISPLLRF